MRPRHLALLLSLTLLIAVVVPSALAEDPSSAGRGQEDPPCTDVSPDCLVENLCIVVCPPECDLDELVMMAISANIQTALDHCLP